jgi:antirestriction protein ArdC
LNPNPKGETIMKETNTTRLDVHQAITDRIIASIEADGAETFRMPWNEAGASGLPTNIASGKHYNGINILALWVASLSLGYSRPIWGTYKQWQEKGCQVRKGEKASLVVFYKTLSLETEGEDTEEPGTTERLFARASYVFNADQVEGNTPANPLPASPRFEPFEAAEVFARNAGAIIREGGTMACYAPAEDVIRMPDRVRFHGTETMSAGEAYYATLAHELTHWTGHASRCNRDLKNRFGSEAYAMEELVAELGAAFLCADLGITPEPPPRPCAVHRSLAEGAQIRQEGRLHRCQPRAGRR